jgi:hypothetical protein
MLLAIGCGVGTEGEIKRIRFPRRPSSLSFINLSVNYRGFSDVAVRRVWS